ncbi:hypothetical protein NDU88_005357 [Pleurodeles waltl]|uniref:Uncharacterized protein n=1 Tax=Pleurodeles waltl TaxID=8319 RepID=A0AAV7N097_PLEWA|nr:hypothetical protein NDU88_005357 [Pleurodeles waltl]
MSPWCDGLISPHQLSSVGPPRSPFQGRSACTALSGTTPGHSSQTPPGTTVRSFRPFAGLQAKLGKDSSAGVCHPEAREPDPRYPPGPCASPTSLQGAREGKLRQSPPDQQGTQKHRSLLRRLNHQAPGPAALSSYQGAAGRLLGPQSPAPWPQGAPRERPVPRPRPRLAPRPHPDCRAEPRSSRWSGATWLRPVPASPEHPGEPHDTGKASRPPPGWPQVAFSGRGGRAQTGSSWRSAILTTPPDIIFNCCNLLSKP